MAERKGIKPIVVLIITLLNVLLLSLGHAYASQLLLWSAIAMFCALVIISHKSNFLPLMLFYLPWTPIVRANPNNNTFVAFILPVVFLSILLSGLKKDQNYKKKYIAFAFLLASYTMVIKLFNGLPLTMQYIGFILMLFFIPIYLSEYMDDISFEECVLFLTVGILSACIASKVLMTNPNMLQYIDVYNEIGLTRLSGFYGDANYFSAQILVAIAGLLVVLSKITRKELILLIIISIMALLYFGMQSVSKMFIFCSASLAVLWFFNLLIEKRKISYKLVIIAVVVIFVGIVIFENLLSEQINYYILRFGLVNDPKSLTTGRSIIWGLYLTYLFSNPDKLFFGIGLSQNQILILMNNHVAHLTIIEILYQLGITGGLILLWWWKSVYQEFEDKTKMDFSQWVLFSIMAGSVFLPWFSLDILYYREFFYFILLLFLSKNYLREKKKIYFASDNS